MANRYWVGGSGTWSDTARWSTSSGGAGGASVPGNSDYAIIDSNSGTPGFTITVSSTTTAFLYLYAQSNVACTLQLNADMLLGSSSGPAYLNTDSAFGYAGTGAIATATNMQSLTILGANTIPAFKHNATSSNGSLYFSASLTVSNAFTWTGGWMYMGTYNLQCATCVLSGSNSKTYNGSTGRIKANAVNTTVVDTTSSSGYTSNSLGGIPIELNGSGLSGTRTVVAATEYVSLYVTAGTDTVALTNSTSAAKVGSVNTTGFTGTFNFNGGGYSANVYGPTLTLPSGITYGASNLYFPMTGGSVTLTTSGQAMPLTLYAGYLNGATTSANYSLSLASNVEVTTSTYLGAGTLLLNGNVLTSPNFYINGSYFKTISYGGGSIKTSYYSNSGSASMGPSSADGTIEMTGSVSNTIYTGGNNAFSKLANITIKLSGSGQLSIYQGNVDIYRLWASYQNNTIKFAAGVFHYISIFDVSGSGSNSVNLYSITDGASWYLYNTGTVNVGNVRLKDASTSGGGSFNATSSQDLGNVFGWNFIVPSGLIFFM